MAALDTLVVASALSTIRLDLGAVGRPARVDRQRLQPELRRAADHRRRARRSLRPPADVRGRAGPLRARVGRLRARPERRPADRRARGPGRRRGARDAARRSRCSAPPSRPSAAAPRSGMFSAITGLAVALGPLVGGAVVEGIDWEWIFWLNVPIGLIAAPLVLAQDARELRPGDLARPARPGARSPARRSASSGGWCAANDAGWGSAEVLGSLAAGLALVVAFVAWERRAPRADAADAAVPQSLVLGRQRGDLLHVRLAVQLRVPVRAVPADRRSATGRSTTGLRLMPVDDHLHPRRPGRRRARRPDRRAPADARRARCCRRSASSGSR